MALTAYSKFYYGFEITPANASLEFLEGSARFNATLRRGAYTLASLATEVARAMNTVGASYSYSAVVDRVTRHITITGSGAFALPLATGFYRSSSVLPLLGFTPTDKAAALSQISESGAGFEYAVQFPIQSFTPAEHNQSSFDPTVNRSTAGVFEVIRFGVEKRLQGEMLFITNYGQLPKSLIRYNPSGVEDARRFFEYATRKMPIEFMPNEQVVDDFGIYLLDSTESDQNGLGFKLIEETDKDLPGFYRTGLLTWLLKETE